jgi:hypothetical protein
MRCWQKMRLDVANEIDRDSLDEGGAADLDQTGGVENEVERDARSGNKVALFIQIIIERHQIRKAA